MMRKKLSAIIALPSLIFGLFTASAYSNTEQLAIGDTAPSFSLKDQHNQLHEINQYKGKWLILYFYPKDDTPGCTKEACNFRDDITQIKQLNASIVGISLDDQSSHAKFANKYSLPFPLLADTEASVTQSYGSLFSFLGLRYAKRHSFIIAPDKTIVKIYRDVNTDTHSQQIINDLSQLIKEENN